MALALLDSSALVAFLDRSDSLHAAARAAIAESARAGRLLSSTVVYAELLTGALRGHHDPQLVRAAVRELGIEFVAVDLEVADQAARLRARLDWLRLPDAIIVATGQQRVVTTVVTGDRSWQRLGDPAWELQLLLP